MANSGYGKELQEEHHDGRGRTGIAISCASPADALVVPIVTPTIADPHEIDQALSSPELIWNATELGVFVADNDGLGVVENRSNPIYHQSRNMRDAVQDEISVCTNQA